jgi:hypothetical protein
MMQNDQSMMVYDLHGDPLHYIKVFFNSVVLITNFVLTTTFPLRFYDFMLTFTLYKGLFPLYHRDQRFHPNNNFLLYLYDLLIDLYTR